MKLFCFSPQLIFLCSHFRLRDHVFFFLLAPETVSVIFRFLLQFKHSLLRDVMGQIKDIFEVGLEKKVRCR